MPKEVPKCEIEITEITEEYYLDMEAFLSSFGITSLEAQIIYEVFSYPEHHVDTKTLADRKIPKELEGEGNVEDAVRHLIELSILRPYESKKPTMCVCCDDMGRLVAEEISNRCYSKALRHYPWMRDHFGDLKIHRCDDLEQFKEGSVRSVHLGGSELRIKIQKILTSDLVVDKLQDGTQIYGRRILATISDCPRCHEDIPIDFTYDHKNIYTNNVGVECPSCRFRFMLARCLRWAYVQQR